MPNSADVALSSLSSTMSMNMSPFTMLVSWGSTNKLRIILLDKDVGLIEGGPECTKWEPLCMVELLQLFKLMLSALDSVTFETQWLMWALSDVDLEERASWRKKSVDSVSRSNINNWYCKNKIAYIGLGLGIIAAAIDNQLIHYLHQHMSAACESQIHSCCFCSSSTWH